MSGIAGIIRFDGKPVPTGTVDLMTQRMQYRGPHGIRHWHDRSVALGQCMFQTTPESTDEMQPLSNEDESVVLVMDGRVDNWTELRSELIKGGARLRTRADAELVLRAYERWGKGCVDHMDGDFALAIWDARQRQAFCVRDRLGLKPFHYHWDGRTLAFASDLAPVLELPWVNEQPNLDLAAEMMADEWYSRGETLWQGIFRLIPAHTLVVDANGLRVSEYWMPDVTSLLKYRSDREYVDHYRELITETVRRQSRSSGMVAVEVSGGLDSTAIFCLTEHLRRRAKLQAPATSGYTLTFDPKSAANEIDMARLVGAHLGVAINEVPHVAPSIDWYAECARATRDFPGYPNGAMHAPLYRQAAADGAEVLLTGLGGDQLLQGSFEYYAEELREGNWRNLLSCILADTHVFGRGHTAWMLVRHGLFPLAPSRFKSALRARKPRTLDDSVRSAYWLSDDMRKRVVDRRSARQAVAMKRTRRRGQGALFQALRYPFDELGRELMERLAAKHAIELRHPFLSTALVQFAFATPERMRRRGAWDKYIHRIALQRLLPQAIASRSTKADFAEVPKGHIAAAHPTWSGLVSRRGSWFTRRGIDRVRRSYDKWPEMGWQNWVLSSVLGCDLVLPEERLQTSALAAYPSPESKPIFAR